MARREAYLEALGLTDWVRRGVGETVDPSPDVAPPVETPSERATTAQVTSAQATSTQPATPPAAPPEASPQVARAGVVIGPGQGSCLYLCSAEDDQSAPLASDLARVLGNPPVWGKVARGDGGQPLELLIAERLLSQVVIFGEAAAQLVFGGAAPATCGPARVTVVDDLRRLGNDAGARRSCWSALKASGVVSPS